MRDIGGRAGGEGAHFESFDRAGELLGVYNSIQTERTEIAATAFGCRVKGNRCVDVLHKTIQTFVDRYLHLTTLHAHAYTHTNVLICIKTHFIYTCSFFPETTSLHSPSVSCALTYLKTNIQIACNYKLKSQKRYFLILKNTTLWQEC